MRMATAIVLWSVAGGTAIAHGPTAEQLNVVAPDSLWRSWSFDPATLAPLLLSLWLYGRGTRQLRRRAGSGQGVTYAEALSFSAGSAVLFVALVSPLDQLGERLLAAHMAQHALLVVVAPPLLLFGGPGKVFAWALPNDGRRRFLVSATWRSLSVFREGLSRPVPATVLHGLALWVWHAPGPFDAALASSAVHALEHACFFGTGLLFWRAILAARSLQRVFAALAAAFATMIHGGLLAAIITMAQYPLYGWYPHRTEPWGLSPLEDQQLAGLIMWVPMGTVYFGTCLLLASRLVVAAGSASQRLPPQSQASMEGVKS